MIKEEVCEKELEKQEEQDEIFELELNFDGEIIKEVLEKYEDNH